MTPPDTDGTAKVVIPDEGPASARLAGPPAHLQEPPIPSKTKSQSIRVAPAVLDAARKDGETLLRDLRTSNAGLTQAEAEERARTTGPNEIAQDHILFHR
jgi:Mg2+-importing ATPase